MSFSYSFRDRPRLSDRIRGKSGDELFKELRKELDQDRTLFFESPSSSPTSNWGSSTGSTFPRAGHFFDDPLMRGHTDIKSHLEDLAQRHPEFADQLRYPAWSNDDRSNTWGRKRRGSGQQETAESSKQQQQENSQSEASEEPGPLRGRPKENLRNTVPDMGQKQQQETEEKESRGQRSWSAPPDNRTPQQEKPRFVSKIEIHPVNPDAPSTQTQSGDATKPPMAPPKPQPPPQQQHHPPPTQPQPKQSNVRHIPIFVEGRDEPVLPKNIEPEFTQTQAPPQHFSRTPPQSHFSSPQQHYQSHTQPKKQQTPPRYEQQQTSPRYEHQPPPARYEQQSTHPKPEPPTQQPEPQQPTVNPRDPLYRVDCVQKEVDELKAKVENFTGNSRSDKEYIVLDELLTRNLIKLDDIETEGREEVRTARKNAIKAIQRCISVLENKVPLPGVDKKETEGEGSDKKMETEESDKNEEEAREKNEMDTMEVEQQQASSEHKSEETCENQHQAATSEQANDKQTEVESQMPQETNTPGNNEVPSTVEEKKEASEVSNEALSNEALEKQVA